MDRGDIYHVNLNPIHGREQAGSRYVLIVTVRQFNRLGVPIVCPITLGGSFARDRGFAVSLSGTGLTCQGVVLCNQLRAIDLSARQAKFIERVPVDVMDEVLGNCSRRHSTTPSGRPRPSKCTPRSAKPASSPANARAAGWSRRGRCWRRSGE